MAARDGARDGQAQADAAGLRAARFLEPDEGLEDALEGLGGDARAVVVDVGVTRIDDASRKRGWRLVGDLDFDGVKEVASAITKVPGGVGPWTITMLLFNTIKAAKRIHGVD